MLRLVRPELPEPVSRALTAMNSSYAAHRTPGWDAFRAARVRSAWKVFPTVWATLCAMSFDKCALCETPRPATVEHRVPRASARGHVSVFAWDNLLAACDTCNRTREAIQTTTLLLDPASPTLDPLDVLGWDDNGEFTPRPDAQTLVDDTVRAYGLHRFKEQRAAQLRRVRFLFSLALGESPLHPEAETRLREELRAQTPWLGPVREYLLRPPTGADKELIRRVFARLPWLREVVAPWLRPPPWATAP